MSGAQAAGFRFRALELHSAYVWDFDWVRQALDFIAGHGMTALVLHRNDIVDQIVYPARLFGGTEHYANIFERYQDIHRALYRYTPTRRSGPYQRRDYLRRVIDLAARRGIAVWFENKELSFPDILLELVPGLVKDGKVCPNEPYWWDFLDTKYTELFQDLPGLAGIITAPGTGESRAAITANRCRCPLCTQTTAPAWYTRLIGAMHRPIRAAGAALAVRDFVFDRAAQEQLAEAIERLPPDVVISLKNTPHDYYPTFPDNPRLGRVGRHPQWVEYDCMGQYFGWGIAPAVMTEDIRRRLAHAAASGADGVIFRTDWESLDGHSAFHTPNLINLIAGAAIARDPGAASLPALRAWLERQGMFRPEADEAARQAAVAWLDRLLGGSWEVTRRTVFVLDRVFSDSTNIPVSLAHAFWLAEEKNSLGDWDPGRAERLGESAANLAAALAEKDEAQARMATLPDAPPAALTDAAVADLAMRMRVFRLLVDGFCAAARALLLVRHRVLNPVVPGAAPQVGEAARLQEALAEILRMAAAYERFGAETNLRHTVYTLLSPERLRALHADLSAQLAATREGRPA